MDHFLNDLVVSFLLQRHVLGMLRGNGWRFLCCYLYTGEVGRDQHQYHVDRNQDVSNHGDHATSVCTYTYRWWNGVGSKFGIYCIDCGGGCYQLAVLFGQCQGADKRGSEKIRQEFFLTWKLMRNDGPKISPLTFFVHLSCFGRVVFVFLWPKNHSSNPVLFHPSWKKSGSETGNAWEDLEGGLSQLPTPEGKDGQFQNPQGGHWTPNNGTNGFHRESWRPSIHNFQDSWWNESSLWSSKSLR